MAKNALESLNNGFGPISNLRSKRWRTMASVAVILLFYICYGVNKILTTNVPLTRAFDLEDLVIGCGVLSAAMFGEIIRRLCLYAEECHHSDTRYMGSRRKALEACLCLSKLPKLTLMFFTLATSVIMYSWISDDKPASTYPLQLYLITAILGSVCTDLLSVKPPTKVEISDLNESQNKHVSDGLAWSYYFGYLTLILPRWDGIFERARGDGFEIENDEADEEGEKTDIRDLITDKRLFIFLPKDGYCYDSFEKVDKRIKFIQTMPDQKIARGGVQERIYKNSLYRITMEDGRKIYVMMEYATPLLSMYDMSMESRAAFSEENREEQVVEFYSKLKEILDHDKECKGKFKLVLTSRGATEDKPKLADMILEAISETEVSAE